jgi:hypothetical protein
MNTATPFAAAPTSTSAKAVLETANAYHRVLFCTERFRVIVCRGDHQWIVQTRKPIGGTHDRPWVARNFCRTKAGMERVTKIDLARGILGLRDFVNGLTERFTPVSRAPLPPAPPRPAQNISQGTTP